MDMNGLMCMGVVAMLPPFLQSIIRSAGQVGLRSYEAAIDTGLVTGAFYAELDMGVDQATQNTTPTISTSMGFELLHVPLLSPLRCPIQPSWTLVVDVRGLSKKGELRLANYIEGRNTRRLVDTRGVLCAVRIVKWWYPKSIRRIARALRPTCLTIGPSDGYDVDTYPLTLPWNLLGHCEFLERVDLGGLEALEEIQSQFQNIRILKTIDLSALRNVHTIGPDFLSSCSLVSVDFTGMTSLEVIGSRCLNNNYALQHVDMSALTKLKSIGAYFMKLCQRLKTIKFPEGGGCEELMTIKEGFMMSCREMVSIDLSAFKHVDEIGSSFMRGCAALTDIDLAPLSNVVSIGPHFMSGCSSLKSIQFEPLRHLSLLPNNFMSFTGLGDTVDLSPLINLEEIGSDVLSWCKQVREVILPNGAVIMSLGPNFMNGSNVSVLDVSPLSHLKVIPDAFLSRCKFQELDLSPLVHITHIGSKFMENCASLERIVLPSGSGDDDDTEGVVVYDAPSVKVVGSGFLSGCKMLASVDVTPLRRINRIAFSFLASCERMEYVDLSPLIHVTDIAEGFMKLCSGLRCVTIPSTFIHATMGSYFMQGCPTQTTSSNNSNPPSSILILFSGEGDDDGDMEVFRKHSTEVVLGGGDGSVVAMRVSVPNFKLLHKKPAAPGQR